MKVTSVWGIFIWVCVNCVEVNIEEKNLEQNMNNEQNIL